MHSKVKASRIIAEVGVNHNGDVKLARELIKAAARAGADVVKFQTFTPELVASPTAPKADYQMVTTPTSETQLQMIKKLQLPVNAYAELFDLATSEGLGFLSTPFDLPSLEFLTGRLCLSEIKIPSGEITNLPFLVEVGKTRVKVVLSTGMSDLPEVATALDSLAWGACAEKDPKTADEMNGFRSSALGREWLGENVEVLHCTSEYPAPLEDVNLTAMKTLADEFGLPVGLSDHSNGFNVAIAAAALGASTIEKHLTLDRHMDGPDHMASIEPDEFESMVRGIREVEMALGSPLKRATPSELRNRELVRRGLVAARDLPVGHQIVAQDLLAVRPSNEMSPAMYWDLLGVRVPQDLKRGETLVVERATQD